jgi:AraC-like DNA-binding protein
VPWLQLPLKHSTKHKSVMNCDGGDVTRVESEANAQLGKPSCPPRSSPRDFPAAGTAISNCTRPAGKSSGKDHKDKNNRSAILTPVQLMTSSRQEIARLTGILRKSRYGAVIRGVDGSVLPVAAPELVNGASRDEDVSVPIRDPDGKPLAFLDILSREEMDSNQTKALLLAIAESAANAIAERCFRICYRKHWVIAAQCVKDPGTCMLLAVDRDYQVVGADFRARQILSCRGIDFAPGLALSVFFRIAHTDRRGGRCFETFSRLLGDDDEIPWYVLTTSPDLGASYFEYSDRALLHSRPRMETLASIAEDATRRKRESAGIPPRSLGRIKVCIDEGLESGVDIGELAQSLGYSLSHFFKLFRKSFGMPPHRYLMHRRISFAQQLLTQTDLDLACIALKAGFADQSHLCRNFHRFIGLPPGAFRMRQR